MGRSMTVAGGAIVGGLAIMVKAFGSFDEAMTRSLAIMGDVSPALQEEMAKTAKQLSTESTFAAKDLAEAYYFLASAGMSAEASISALAPVARFAQAGTFDLAQATDLLTDAQTAMGLSSKNVIENEKNLIRVSDVLVGANTLANASVQQFAEALTNRAAPALTSVGKSLEEGVAILAAFADKGIKGRKAGMQLAMMMNALDMTARANKKAWDKLGLSLFDSEGEMRNMGNIIGDLEVKLGHLSPEARGAQLEMLGFTAETKNSIQTLMGSSEKILEWTEALKEMQGITKEVADKQLEAFNMKLKIAKNTVMLAAMGIGKSLAPTIVELAAKVKSVAERIAKWIEKHPKLTAALAKLALGVGALLLVLGPMVMMLPGIAAGMIILSKSATLMAIKVKVLTAAKTAWAVVNAKLGLSFTMLLGPIGLAIAAAMAFGVIINKVINAHKKKLDADMDAMIMASKGHARFHAFRRKLIADEVVTVEEWAEIYKKHGKDYKRVMTAISKLPEYAHIKAELDAIIEKEKELAEGTRTNSEEVVSLMSKMADEIFKATHNEFKYRRRMALKTWEERKAVLDAEKAATDAYVMAKKAYTAELNQIEKDRTEKLREEVNERARSLRVSLDKMAAVERTYREKVQSIAATSKDIINRITMSNFNYERGKLNEKYTADLIAAEGNTAAMLAIIKAYQLQKAEIDTKEAESKQASLDKMATIERAHHEKIQSIAVTSKDIINRITMSSFDYERGKLNEKYAEDLIAAEGNTAAMLLITEAYNLKQAELVEAGKTKWQDTMKEVLAGLGSVIGAMDSMFSQFHANEAMRLDNEEKEKTDAIESWYEREQERIERTITDEEELVAALEALDEEKARKENKLQHDMDKERRKLERARAKREKASAIFSATISMAEAIVKAFTAGPLIGQILAGITAGLCAIQIAAIAAAPLPALQRGGTLGAGEPAIVGEAGPELFMPDRPGTIIPIRNEAIPVTSTSMRMRIIIQNKITIGEQTFYKETVKSVNKAGPLRDIVIPNVVVV